MIMYVCIYIYVCNLCMRACMHVRMYVCIQQTFSEVYAGLLGCNTV
jgi:hypothetical protein